MDRHFSRILCMFKFDYLLSCQFSRQLLWRGRGLSDRVVSDTTKVRHQAQIMARRASQAAHRREVVILGQETHSIISKMMM